MPRCTFTHERLHPDPVAGVDEAGRGPLAGPVVAAAVVLPARGIPRGINDSKKLCADRRADLHGEIRLKARVGVGIASVEEIDRLNIYWATMLAMERAVEALCADGGCDPAMVLVDGNRTPRWRHTSLAIVEGDAKSLSIAAASIIAKHERDQQMIALDAQHPGYGWARNKGYGTRDHQAALAELGATPHHRRSFAPVAQLALL
jgi:ribonuclease HII